jgi:hypothetical protein
VNKAKTMTETDSSKSDKQRIAEAVAEKIINEKIVNAKQRSILKSAINRSLDQLARDGALPKIQMHDKEAGAAKHKSITRPVVERNAERTR